MNNAIFRKAMENIRKYKVIKLVTQKQKNFLVSEPNIHTTKFFTENVLAIEMKRNQIITNIVYWDYQY